MGNPEGLNRYGALNDLQPPVSQYVRCVQSSRRGYYSGSSRLFFAPELAVNELLSPVVMIVCCDSSASRAALVSLSIAQVIAALLNSLKVCHAVCAIKVLPTVVVADIQGGSGGIFRRREHGTSVYYINLCLSLTWSPDKIFCPVLSWRSPNEVVAAATSSLHRPLRLSPV